MSFEKDLHSLRDGTLSFDWFATTHSDVFSRWAASFFNKWPQTSLDLQDLKQEALLEAWRCVDTWDPTRGTSLKKYVYYNVGRKMRVELERVLGWPKKYRGQKPVRPMSTNDNEPLQRTVEEKMAYQPRFARRTEIRQIVEHIAGSDLDKLVIAGVGIGLCTDTVAKKLWDDPKVRLSLRLDSVEESKRRVRRTANRLAKEGVTPV